MITQADKINDLNIDCRDKYEMAKADYDLAWKDDGYIKFAFKDNSYIALKIEAVKKRLY